ncbi:hypothetical protein JNM87_05490 [Candidatus Saccharibacteria bacterium]|nr:hypothetical protein [Candidatus Saccharibacteria bacterium]
MSTIQYTIRQVPPVVDQAIRKQARASGKSFNQTVVDMLSLQTFGTTNPKAEGFEWLFGQNTLDDGFDQAIKEQSRIDTTMWQ